MLNQDIERSFYDSRRDPGADRRLYLEDLQVGQRFVSGSHVIDKEQNKAFAAQFDPQVFHLDDEAAKTTWFGGLAASGWHTAAITMRLLVDSGAPIAGGVIGAGGKISWPRPTRPGDCSRWKVSTRNSAVPLKAGSRQADAAQ